MNDPTKYIDDKIMYSDHVFQNIEGHILKILFFISIEIFLISYIFAYGLNTKIILFKNIFIQNILFISISITMSVFILMIPLWKIHSFLKTIKIKIINLVEEEMKHWSNDIFSYLYTIDDIEGKKLNPEDHIKYISLIMFRDRVKDMSDWPIRPSKTLIHIVKTLLIEVLIALIFHVIKIYY